VRTEKIEELAWWVEGYGLQYMDRWCAVWPSVYTVVGEDGWRCGPRKSQRSPVAGSPRS
jgi:hypothetical protein